MKTYIKYIFAIIMSLIFELQNVNAQAYPIGLSLDSIIVSGFNSRYRSDSTFIYSVYKPTGYDSITSPILFAIHGTAGTGANTIPKLQNIADRRNAMIIAPNVSSSGCIRLGEAITVYVDTIEICPMLGPATVFFKELYKQIKFKENRTSIPSYLIGFSAGGQFVTRYMLIRQAYPDSIPIQMAVSADPYYYTFPTDTFNGTPMPWLCGFIPPVHSYCPSADRIFNFFCDEDVVQYYNENYGVLVGTADIAQLNDAPCAMVQGNNRYERAHTFYDFCDSNATNRGLTLMWQQADVPGIGHDEYGLYNTKASPTDSSTIAETLLFDTPYHTVPSVAPVVSFYADSTYITINDSVHFINNSFNTSTYLWEFGDSTTSTLVNPAHLYSVAGTYTVQLTAGNANGCNTWNERRHYIIVTGTADVDDIYIGALSLQVNPNPAKDKINITSQRELHHVIISLISLQGQLIQQQHTNSGAAFELNLSSNASGIYFLKLQSDEGMIAKKVIVQE